MAGALGQESVRNQEGQSNQLMMQHYTLVLENHNLDNHLSIEHIFKHNY